MEYYNYDDMTSFVNAYGVENVERQGHADALLTNVMNFCYESANKVPAPSEAASEAESQEETTAAETTAAR